MIHPISKGYNFLGEKEAYDKAKIICLYIKFYMIVINSQYVPRG